MNAPVFRLVQPVATSMIDALTGSEKYLIDGFKLDTLEEIKPDGTWREDQFGPTKLSPAGYAYAMARLARESERARRVANSRLPAASPLDRITGLARVGSSDWAGL